MPEISIHNDGSNSSTLQWVIDNQNLGRLKVLAQIKNCQPHEVIQQALLQYLDAEEKQLAFIFSLHQATAEYEKSGLHISLDAYQAWVKNIQTQPNEPLPPCQP
jgi:predicted transcriptional regulator